MTTHTFPSDEHAFVAAVESAVRRACPLARKVACSDPRRTMFGRIAAAVAIETPNGALMTASVRAKDLTSGDCRIGAFVWSGRA